MIGHVWKERLIINTVCPNTYFFSLVEDKHNPILLTTSYRPVFAPGYTAVSPELL